MDWSGGIGEVDCNILRRLDAGTIASSVWNSLISGALNKELGWKLEQPRATRTGRHFGVTSDALSIIFNSKYIP